MTSKINVTLKVSDVRKTAVNCNTLMKLNRSNKFDFCNYGQVNSPQQKSFEASEWESKHVWGYLIFILLVMVKDTMPGTEEYKRYNFMG